MLWFGFIRIPESPEAMQVMPLSLMHFFNPAIIEPWLVYSLNTLNVFEVFYILLLTALMAVAVQIKFRKVFEIIFEKFYQSAALNCSRKRMSFSKYKRKSFI